MPEATIASFVLRFIEEYPPETEPGAAARRGVIRHVQSSAEMRFTRIESALAFIARYVDITSGGMVGARDGSESQEEQETRERELEQGEEKTMRLQDRVTLITGGAAGIGKAAALRFAEEGAKVVICDVNQEVGQETVAELGPDAAFYKVDVTDRQAVQEWIDDVVARYGRIDVLINNAGVLRDNQLVKVKEGQLVKQMPEEEFDLVIAVNLKGVFNCAQAVAPYMIKQGSGVILNATSVVGLDGNFGQTNYVATKAGVIGMTKVWARELGRHNIRVNAVAPGFTLTEMVLQMPEKILQSMAARTPLGRLGQPRDVADAYLFLASDEASFISGVVLRVDGGIVVGT